MAIYRCSAINNQKQKACFIFCGGNVVKRCCELILILGLFPLNVLAESPNDVVAEAASLLDQELKARKEELINDKQALYVVIDDILLPRFDRK